MATKTKPVKKSKNSKSPKSKSREWLDSIVFAVIAATLIRWFLLEAYVIPSGSMERTLLVGDYLFVSKVHYGARTPQTPLQVPLTHQTLWGTNTPSYLDWIQLPMYRFPGLQDVERGDIVVFNDPKEIQHPVDQRIHVVKRAVGLPGDKIEVRDQQVYADGKLVSASENVQQSYLVKMDQFPNERFFLKYGLYEIKQHPEGLILDLTNEMAAEIKGLPFVTSLEPFKRSKDEKEAGMLPEWAGLNWNADNFGPITVPARGLSITLTKDNIAKYFRTIKDHEGLEEVEYKNEKVFINGEAVNEYIFQQDYYFMMGDNRHASFDSRFWGFVPADHIVGKALFIWMSIDSHQEFLDKIRWNRIFDVIE